MFLFVLFVARCIVCSINSVFVAKKHMFTSFSIICSFFIILSTHGFFLPSSLFIHHLSISKYVYISCNHIIHTFWKNTNMNCPIRTHVSPHFEKSRDNTNSDRILRHFSWFYSSHFLFFFVLLKSFFILLFSHYSGMYMFRSLFQHPSLSFHLIPFP